jgi:hypothetical protein
MKNRHLTTIVVASSLMLPFAAFGGDKSKTDKHNETKASTSSWSERNIQPSSSHADIKRVDRDKLDSKLTAKELIGKEVVDMNGERLGSIHDIGLAQALPDEFRAGESAEGATGIGATQNNSIHLYVAVGGVMGLGSDIVSVPADRFGFDRENDRLTLDIPEDQFSSIADPDKDNSDFAATDITSGTDATTPGYASGAGATSWTAGATATELNASNEGITGTRSDVASNSKQEDVRKIERALKDENDLKDIASQVVVAQSGDAILISGAVNEEAQKERVLELAREHTDMEVRDYLRVSSAAE